MRAWRVEGPRPMTMRMSWTGAITAVLLGVAAADAVAADAVDRLKKIERQLETSRQLHGTMSRKAEAAAKEIRAMKLLLVRVAVATQSQESEVTRLEMRIEDLTRRISEATASLRQRRRQMTGVLAALQRLARHPPVALAAMPGRPVDTVRSAIVMRSALPALESRSRTLSKQLAALSRMRSELKNKRAELNVAAVTLERKRDKVARLILAKVSLERKARAESKAARGRVTELTAEARDLKELLEKLEAESRAAVRRRKIAERKAAEQRTIAERKAEAERLAAAQRLAAAERRAEERRRAELLLKMPRRMALTEPKDSGARIPRRASRIPLGALPARGRIVRRFGDRNLLGGKSKGVRIQTRHAAQVTAPRGGDVVFAGPFRGYGKILIIRHNDGHLALLSGLGRVDAEVGDRLLAGEPIGVMDAASQAKPTLYFELRRKGLPVNPMPWLLASRSKVSG